MSLRPHHATAGWPMPWPTTLRRGWTPHRRLRDMLRAAVALPLLWQARVRQRRNLGDLDLSLQRDIGVTPSEVETECNKWFWQS